MNRRTLFYIVIGWCLLTLFEYYFVPYFIVALFWVGLSIGLFIVSIIELIKLIKERKLLSKLRILKVIIFPILFYFTFKPWIVHGLIEKVDWKIFYNKRMDIVEKVKRNEYSSNQNGVYKLPFEFPVLSNGGNEIVIYRNKKNKSVTVTFWVYRNFFSAPSTSFIYTNDKEEKEELEKQVSNHPDRNWKIQDNWYRTFGE